MRTIEEIIPETMSKQEFSYHMTKSFSFFCERVLGLTMSRSGFHKEWCDLAQTKNRLLLFAPRDHSKTTIFFKAFPLWRSMVSSQDRELIYGFSSTQDIANKALGEMIDDYVRDNEMLQRLEPAKAVEMETWKSSEVKMSTNLRYVVKGFGVSTRGPHPHYIICDDILGDRMMFNHEFYESYFKGAITNMVSTDGSIFVVGMPLRDNDILMKLKSNPAYYYKSYPAISDNNLVLFPERWSLEQLNMRKDEIGELFFMREFLLRPLEDSQVTLFPLSLISSEKIKDFTMAYLEKGEPGKLYIIACDPAYSQTGSWCAFVVCELKDNNMLDVVFIYRQHGMEGDDVVDFIKDLAARFPPAFVVVEKNIIHSFLSKLQGLNLPIYFPIMDRTKKLNMLLVNLRGRFQHSQIKLRCGDEFSSELTSTLLNELNDIAFINGKLKARSTNDDLVMALAWANEASYTGSFAGTDAYFLK